MTSFFYKGITENAVPLISSNLESALSENFATLTEGHTIPINHIDFKIGPNLPDLSHIL